MTRNVVWRRTFGLVGLWLLLGACGGTSSDGRVDGVAGAWQTPSGGQGTSAGAGDAGAGADDPIGAASAMNVGLGGSENEPSHGSGHGGNRGHNPGHAGASGETTAGGDAGNDGGAPVDELMIPCDVYAATSVCRNCHLDPPLNDAPMPLLSLQDLQAHADDAYQAVLTGVMPAAGTLSAGETALILAWLEAGAQGVPRETCP